MLATAAGVLQLVRDAGALAQLPIHLSAVALVQGVDGRLGGCRLARRGDRQRGGGNWEPLGAGGG